MADMKVDKTDPKRLELCRKCQHEDCAGDAKPCNMCWNPIGDMYLPTPQGQRIEALEKMDTELAELETQVQHLREKRERMGRLYEKEGNGVSVTFGELANGDEFFWFWQQHWLAMVKCDVNTAHISFAANIKVPFEASAEVPLVKPDQGVVPTLNCDRQAFGSVPIGTDIFVEVKKRWTRVRKTYNYRAQPMPDGETLQLPPLMPVRLSDPSAALQEV